MDQLYYHLHFADLEAEPTAQGHTAIGDKITLESRQPDPRILTLHCYL